MNKIKDFFKKYFITGLLVIIPVWATFYVLRAILGWIDGMLGPLLGTYLELRFPGVGIVNAVREDPKRKGLLFAGTEQANSDDSQR